MVCRTQNPRGITTSIPGGCAYNTPPASIDSQITCTKITTWLFFNTLIFAYLSGNNKYTPPEPNCLIVHFGFIIDERLFMRLFLPTTCSRRLLRANGLSHF